jgi:hypothetical protein
MAGTGKSFWTDKLTEYGFQSFRCDDLIAAKLNPELERPDGSIKGMGEWMGLPFEPQYEEREGKYLAYEIEVTTEILLQLEKHASSLGKDIVIDTAGSVIYAGKRILNKMRQHTITVHLATPPEVQAAMFASYLRRPGPVLWRGMFSRGPNETNEEALGRCYPKLLAAREKEYFRYSHVSIGYHRLREEGFTVKDFLTIARRSKASDSEERSSILE